MNVHAYLNFKGQAKEAMYFYSKVLGTKEPDIMLFKDMPPNPEFPIPKECEDWVMHGSIEFNGQLIMFSDMLSSGEYKVGNNISLLIDMDDLDPLKSMFDKFSEGAKITMPFAPTFWAKGFGSLIDKFGIEWQFNCSHPKE